MRGVRRAVVLGAGQQLRDEDEEDHLPRRLRVAARSATRAQGDHEQRGKVSRTDHRLRRASDRQPQRLHRLARRVRALELSLPRLGDCLGGLGEYRLRVVTQRGGDLAQHAQVLLHQFGVLTLA